MTPKPYLSYSQLMLFERSPKKYCDIYLKGFSQHKNDAMKLGSKVADALEWRMETEDAKMNDVIGRLPKLARADEEFVTVVPKSKLPEVPIIIKPDAASEDWLKLYEYKTGHSKWTQGKVDKNDQLTFYAMGVWLKTKKIPELKLFWMPTVEEFGSRVLTGEIVEFETSRNLGDISAMMIRAREGWEGIKKLVDETL